LTQTTSSTEHALPPKFAFERVICVCLQFKCPPLSVGLAGTRIEREIPRASDLQSSLAHYILVIRFTLLALSFQLFIFIFYPIHVISLGRMGNSPLSSSCHPLVVVGFVNFGNGVVLGVFRLGGLNHSEQILNHKVGIASGYPI